jgi:two-component system response regulator YesN
MTHETRSRADSIVASLCSIQVATAGSGPEPEGSASGPKDPTREGTRRERILLVEDDRGVRELIRRFLSDLYEISPAATGAEALAILRREPVAAIVLDYRLPDRTGLEVLNDIRATWPTVPVVMMTGYGSEWICASAFKLGVWDYLPKPVILDDLLRSVREILSSGSQEGATRRAESGAVSQPDPHAGAPPGASDPAIRRAITLIQQRYWDQLSLGRVAREVGMSKYYLSRRFRAVMGVTFRQYLLRVRLERAKVLLSTTSVSITEVAQGAGFSDLPRFDKLFRRYTGVPPSAYRAKLIQKSQ